MFLLFFRFTEYSWPVIKLLFLGVNIHMSADNKNTCHILSPNHFLLFKFIFIFLPESKEVVAKSYNEHVFRKVWSRSTFNIRSNEEKEFSKKLINNLQCWELLDVKDIDSSLLIFDENDRNIGYKFDSPAHTVNNIKHSSNV